MQGIQEKYSQACTSSNLRVEGEKSSSADILIASGMSKSDLGAALMRLRAEYSSDSVPKRNATDTDHRLMMGRLKTLSTVLTAVKAQAQGWGIDRPEAVAKAIISHWLDSICRQCEGRGKDRIKDTPNLSNNNCRRCQGVGRIDLTYGSEGRRLAGFIADCVNDWEIATKKLMRNSY